MSLLLSDAPPLHRAIGPIAADLRAISGARLCSILLYDGAGEAHTAHASDLPRIPASDRAAYRKYLAKAAATGAASSARISDTDVIARPMRIGNRTFGAALLVFPAGQAPAGPQLDAALQLAARAADTTRQISALQSQTEEIVEGMRLHEIQLSRNLIRGVIDSVPIGLALVDANGSIRAINRALAERFGREPAGLVGLSYGGTLGAWEESPCNRTFATGQPQRARRTLPGSDRSTHLLEIASFPIGEPGSQPTQVVEVWEDITERVSLQTQLVRAEKLAAIGQLAASIAHEVGNPLQAIQGFLSLFLEQCDPDTPNQHFLKLAEEEIERIVHVLARLRDLYRPRADVMAPSDLNELIEGVLLLTSKQLERRRIRVRKELAPDLPQIELVADQIKQVVLNMVLNAADAMSEGGILHIQTYIQRDRNGGRAVTLTITDTGIGIPADQLAYVFDGLHTTKERGMGLGLYTSKAIIERHMGRIMAQSQVGEGTTFVIMLPLRDDEIESHP